MLEMGTDEHEVSKNRIIRLNVGFNGLE